MTASTPVSLALAIDTPAGMIVHTGDFKIDDAPVDGERFDTARFAELGEAGVRSLLSISTNVERRGRTDSESSLKPILREMVRKTTGKFCCPGFLPSASLSPVRRGLSRAGPPRRDTGAAD